MAKKQPAPVPFLLVILFYSEDGVNIFLRNVELRYTRCDNAPPHPTHSTHPCQDFLLSSHFTTFVGSVSAERRW